MPNDEHNQILSENRAKAVVMFLMQNFGISQTRLIALGFGETRLKNPNAPDAAENRRVEVVNLGVQ
jgi:flagellar motor protein MotB